MDIKEIIKLKFTSSGRIPVESIRITRKEYDQLINSVKEECAKIVDWDEKLFKLWWNKMSKGANKDELIEERLARNIWMAASCYFVEAIRDEEDKPPKKRGGCDVC